MMEIQWWGGSGAHVCCWLSELTIADQLFHADVAALF